MLSLKAIITCPTDGVNMQNTSQSCFLIWRTSAVQTSTDRVLSFSTKSSSNIKMPRKAFDKPLNLILYHFLTHQMSFSAESTMLCTSVFIWSEHNRLMWDHIYSNLVAHFKKAAIVYFSCAGFARTCLSERWKASVFIYLDEDISFDIVVGR